MTLRDLLLGALSALQGMQHEDRGEVAILKQAMAKSMHMATGDQVRWN